MNARCLSLSSAVVGIAIIASLGTFSARAQVPFFMGLGTGTDPEDISNDGTVVVGDVPLEKSFRWTRESGLTTLSPLYGSENVSADGSTVVIAAGTQFRWTNVAGLVQVPLASDVSGDGSILVGTVRNQATGLPQAAVWSEASGLQPLSLSVGESHAWEVSGNGQVIVGESGDRIPFTWSVTEGVTWLNLPSPLSSDGSLIKISENGKVVTSIMGLGADRRGFRWTKETGVVEVGRLPGGPWMSATGVSGDGSIIVGNSQNVSPQRPAIWDAVHGPRYLDDILVNDLNLGVSLAGWKNLLAFGVSGDGRNVIGVGTNPSGVGEGWIAYLGPPAILTGDFNQNGTVDAADYIVWRNGLGTTHTQSDYDTWRAHFGRTAASVAAVDLPISAHPVVPEPTTLALAALVAASIPFLSRGRHSSVSMSPLLTFTVSAALTSTNIAPAQQPFFMGLGDLPGGSFFSAATELQGISHDGKVVVGFSSSSISSNSNEAFRWTRETGMVGLGIQSLPHVSADGTTIAGVHNPTPFSFVAYRWRSGTGVVPLPFPFRVTVSCCGVSGDGSIIAATSNSSGPQRAVRWSEPGGLEFLPAPNPGVDNPNFYSHAWAISADGSVVYGSWDGAGRFLWSNADGIILTDLPDLYSNSHLSGDGSVIVYTAPPVGTDRRGYRWTKETGSIELGRLPDGPWMSAFGGVSADGSIIAGNSQNVSPSRPAIWDALHGPRYLDDILVNELDLGDEMTGWNGLVATGISGDGRTVIGRGTNPDGNSEAWIAYLGAPATLAGDFNTDGTVDAADYVTWRDRLGTIYTQSDYDLWRANFGRNAASATAANAGPISSASPAVPEPATFTLLVLAITHVAWRRRCDRVIT